MKLNILEKATSGKPVIDLHFLDDVAAGLSASPKRLSAKYFYDARGSRLFDAICELEEYYPTRTEMGILRAHAAEIAMMAGKRANLVEFGAGSLQKVRILLDRMRGLSHYIPVDISTDHLQGAANALARRYKMLTILPIAGDFTRPVSLPVSSKGGMVGFFPGSTIGNFTPQAATEFLKSAAFTLGPGALFVVGFDLKKDRQILEAAYNDKKDVTAAFNLNLLTRINRELDGNFDLSAFSHLAFFNEAESRIEMHLKSERDQSVTIGGYRYHFERGETIHTENSYKYEPEAFTKMAAKAGWQQRAFWTDSEKKFAVSVLQSEAATPAPTSTS